MTLEELMAFVSADSPSDRQIVLDAVNSRVGTTQSTPQLQQPNKIKILTMHGAKGLGGKVVFIPGLEQGIMPSFKSLLAAGLVIEQRRLFYVSLTRAMACCIVSHSAQHSGAQAMVLRQSYDVRLTRSQFLSEMGIPSVTRTSGLNSTEAAAIIADIRNL